MSKMVNSGKQKSSFRDPCGFLFYRKGILYRQINELYREDYSLIMSSGLYDELIKKKLLIPHNETKEKSDDGTSAYKVICPDVVPFISYPYEWTFSELKDAALTTLKIQKLALKHNMSLKDSSAYNIQFINGAPLLIDSLSFEKYVEGMPWVAYRQFCQHFLAPLALIAYKDIRMGQLSKVYIDGVPLDLASLLLPWKSKFSFGMLTHIHMHAKSQKYYADKQKKIGKSRTMSKIAILGLIDNLESIVKNLKWNPGKTEWFDYYENNLNYSDHGLDKKKDIIAKYLEKIKPLDVWDIGANIGLFSRISAEKNINTISFDIDPACVEYNYLKCRSEGEKNILPLLLDLTNPTPAIGWDNTERSSLSERGPVDCVFALALVHHLAIGNNLPLGKIADYFKKICRNLIIEFVPKNDSQVQRLLASRVDIFPDYTKELFEKEFKKRFKVIEAIAIKDSERTLYFMKL